MLRNLAQRAIALWMSVLLTTAMTGCGRQYGDTVERQSGSQPSSLVDSQQIAIDHFSFEPAELRVNTGDKVTWLNRDDVPHTVTSASQPRVLNSGTLDTEDQWSFTFVRPGVYEYFCAAHPKMTGRIVVQ